MRPATSTTSGGRLRLPLVSAALAATVVAPLVAVTGAPVASAGPCSTMFGNFGSLRESQTGAGMGGSSGSANGSLGSQGTSGSAGSSRGTSGSLGSLADELETGSLGNTLSGSLDQVTGSAFGLPPWTTGEQGTVPVLKGPTRFLQLVTGPTSPTRALEKYGVGGTDLGIMWDNGNAAKPEVLMAFGDTMGDCTKPGSQWRSNVLFRSSTPTADLDGGVRVDSSPVGPDGLAKSIVPRTDQPGEVTKIPTAGIAIDGVQYLRFMSVSRWATPGSWDTAYSGLAYSTDNGENWTVVPGLARPVTSSTSAGEGAPPVDRKWAGSQMSSFVRGHGADSGYLYEYLTPSGRSGPAIVARAGVAGTPAADALSATASGPGRGILDPQGYEYYDGSGWTRDLGRARTVLPAPTSEMSVMWNAHLGKYVTMYSSGLNSVLIRTADRPEGPWSSPTTLIDYSVLPGVYGGFMHPWSDGKDLYYMVTTWNAYNVFLVRSDLDALGLAGTGRRAVAEPAGPQGTEVVRQVPVSELADGRVPTE